MTPRTPEQVQQFCQRVQAFWQDQGTRRTQVREVLVRTIAEQAAPFSAEVLLREARKIDRIISSASVYRTLGHLVTAGLLREIPGPRDTRCYAVVDTAHAGVSNIVCTDCEQVVPLEDECLPLREGFLAKQLGFNPSKMSLRIEASCDELRARGDCHRRRGPAGE